jgi:hypothetical protein
MSYISEGVATHSSPLKIQNKTKTLYRYLFEVQHNV